MRPPASGQSWTGVNPKCVRHRKRPADWHSFTRSVRPERLYSKCEQEHRPIPAHSTRGLDSLLHTSPCSRDSRLGCHSSTRLHPARSAVLPCNDALPAPTQAPRLPPLQQIRVSRFHLDLPIRPCISLDPLFQPPNASQFHPRYVSHSALRSFGVPQTNLTRRSSARESNPKPWTGLTPKVASLGKKPFDRLITRKALPLRFLYDVADCGGARCRWILYRLGNNAGRPLRWDRHL